MMKRLKHIFTMLCLMVGIGMSYTSCGLIDFDFDESLEPVYNMHLNRDTVYVIVGDTFSLQPIYEPGIVADGDVFWHSESESVVRINNNVIIASAVGQTMVSASSVIQQGLTDSCFVSVMSLWEADPYAYSNEMVVNARVIIDGVTFNPNTMKVAAFVGSECRGEGVLKILAGVDIVQFRIWGNLLDESGNPEVIRFRFYIHDKLQCEYFPNRIFFDGKMHGTLSEPVNIIY